MDVATKRFRLAFAPNNAEIPQVSPHPARLSQIFDLNLYEVKVWTALLSCSFTVAEDIAEIDNNKIIIIKSF